MIEYGSPRFERMRANRRYGFTIAASDALCSVRPSRRLRDAVADAEWIAILEGMAFRGEITAAAETYADGSGI